MAYEGKQKNIYEKKLNVPEMVITEEDQQEVISLQQTEQDILPGILETGEFVQANAEAVRRTFAPGEYARWLALQSTAVLSDEHQETHTMTDAESLKLKKENDKYWAKTRRKRFRQSMESINKLQTMQESLVEDTRKKARKEAGQLPENTKTLSPMEVLEQQLAAIDVSYEAQEAYIRATMRKNAQEDFDIRVAKMRKYYQRARLYKQYLAEDSPLTIRQRKKLFPKLEEQQKKLQKQLDSIKTHGSFRQFKWDYVTGDALWKREANAESNRDYRNRKANQHIAGPVVVEELANEEINQQLEQEEHIHLEVQNALDVEAQEEREEQLEDDRVLKQRELIREGPKTGHDLEDENARRDEWVLGQYEEVTNAYLENEGLKETDNALLQKLFRLNRTVTINTRALAEYIKTKTEKTLGMTRIEEAWTKQVAKEMGDKIFLDQDAFEQAMEQACSDSTPELFEKASARQSYFKNQISAAKDLPDLWKREDVQKLILDEADEEKFKATVKGCRDQWIANETTLRTLAEKKVSRLSREDVVSHVIKKMGSYIIMGATGIVSAYTQNALDVLHLEASELYQREQMYKKCFAASGIDSVYEESVQTKLADEIFRGKAVTEPELAAALSDLAATITENEKIMEEDLKEAKLPAQTWKSIEKFSVHSVLLSKDDFRAALKALSDERLVAEGEKTYTRKDYLYGVEAGTITFEKADFDNLLDQYIFRYEGFVNEKGKPLLDQKHRDLVKQGLDTLLADEKNDLAKEFPELKEVHGADQLNLLPYNTMQAVLERLRGNLAEGILVWRNYDGLNATKLKQQLVVRMLSGHCDASKVQQVIDEMLEQSMQEEQEARKRFGTQILAGGMEKTSVEYLYMKVEGGAAGMFSSAKFPVADRVARCGYAREAWKAVESAGVSEIMTKLVANVAADIADAKKKKNLRARLTKLADNLQKWEAFRNEQVTKKNKTDEEAAKLFVANAKNGLADFTVEGDVHLTAEVLTKLSEAFKAIETKNWANGESPKLSEYIGEMLLHGMQDDAFCPGGAGERVFTTFDDDAYLGGLAELSLEIAGRRTEVEKALGHMDPKVLPAEQRDVVLKRLYPVIQGLEPHGRIKLTREEKANAEHRNLLRYGVKNINDLIGRLTEMYAAADSKEMRWSKKETERFVHYRDMMRTYRDGLFAPMLNELIADPTVWKNMCCRDEQGFENYLRELEGTVGIALSQLQTDENRASVFVNRQFVLTFKDEILSQINAGAEKKTPQYWEDKISEYYVSFMDYAPAGRKSINARMNKVEDKTGTRKGWLHILHSGDTTFPWMLELLLHSDPSAFTILFREETMLQTYERIKKNWFENLEILSKHVPYMQMLKEHKGKMTPEIKDKLAMVRQLVEPKVALLEPKYLEEHWMEIWADLEKEINSARVPDMDRAQLSKKAKACNAVRKKNAEGERAYSNYLGDRSEMRRMLNYIGSPVLAAYGRAKPVSEDDVKSARKKMKKRLKETGAPEIVTEIMAERSLANGKYTEKEQQRDFDWLMKVHGMIKDRMNDHAAEGARGLNARLVYCFTYMARQRDDVKADAPTIDMLLGKYENNRRFVDEVDAFEPQHPALKADFVDFKNELRMAHIVRKDAMEELYNHGLRYFKTSDVVLAQIDEVLEAKKEELGLDSAEKRARYFAGLRAYFLKGIMTDCRKEQATNYRPKIAEALADPLTRQYIFDSSSLMQRVASTDQSVKEQQEAGAYSRKSMEDIIASCKDEELITAYNGLNLNQRRIFALALSMPGEMVSGEGMVTANLVLPEERETVKVSHDLQMALADYIGGKDFEARIDYAMVVRRLTKVDEKTRRVRMSKTMFNNAMAYVTTVEKKRTEAIPKDFERMGNAKLTLKYGSIAAGVTEDREKEVTEAHLGSRGDFVAYMRQIAEKDKNADLGKIKKLYLGVNIDDLLSKVEKLTDTSMAKLVMILQDRTAIDYTTAGVLLHPVSGEVTDFANKDQREKLKDNFTQMTPESTQKLLAGMSPVGITNAMRSLLSFQVRDDVDITGRRMRSDDFDSSSVKRPWKMDWQLLQRALDLLGEMEQEDLKITAVRGAREHIDDAYNEKAKAEYAKHKNEADMSKDSFEAFMKENALADKENEAIAMPLLASYHKLSDNEKILFVRALEHRDILDVSRENLYLSALGINDRDYVNPKERDNLINEYLDKTEGKKTSMKLSDDSFYNAMKSLLSTQVDDTREFKKETDYKELFAGQKWYERVEYKTRRNTAVDWKLFARALQLVKRTAKERETIQTDRELYRSQGNLLSGGLYVHDPEYLRKNLHGTGNRFNRFIARRLNDELNDAIPGSKYGKMLLLAAMNTRRRNAVLEKGFLVPEEEEEKDDPGLVLKINGYVGMGGKYLAKGVGYINTTGAEITGIVGTSIAHASDAISRICDMAGTFSNKKKISESKKEAEEFKKQDEERKQKAAQNQTEEEKAMSDRSLARNQYLQDMAAEAAKHANSDQFIDKIFSYAKDLAKDEDVLGIFGVTEAVLENTPIIGYIPVIINEVGKLIRFFGQLLTDKKMLGKYYAQGGPFHDEISSIRKNGLAAAGIADGEKKLEEYSDVDLAEKAYGFEGFDEHAQYVGLDLVHNILFTASRFNPNKQMRFRGMVIMQCLGMEGDIGKLDSETAMKMYGKLVGEEFV